MIGFVWAEDEDGWIGRDGDLPWHLPADMARFKQLTTGHTVVMGKSTFESMKRSLPNRRNIVVSTSLAPQTGIEIVKDITKLGDILAKIDDDVYIIGGAKLFAATVGLADRLFRTVIEHHFDGDTKMPPIDYTKWQSVERLNFEQDEKNHFAYRFETWVRSNKE